MSPSAEEEYERIEAFRPFLMMVAHALIGHTYRRKFSAEDMVNQTLLEAFQAIHQLRKTTHNELAAWLREALENTVRDSIRYLHRKKRDIKREQTVEFHDEDASITLLANLTDWSRTSYSCSLRQERQINLGKAIAQLPQSQRRAIELHHLQGCTLQETAAELQRSPASTAGLLRRGIKNLRKRFEAPQSEA